MLCGCLIDCKGDIPGAVHHHWPYGTSMIGPELSCTLSAQHPALLCSPLYWLRGFRVQIASAHAIATPAEQARVMIITITDIVRKAPMLHHATTLFILYLDAAQCSE